MKKIFHAAVLTGALLTSGQALAEKIAVVGVQQALRASDAAAEFRTQLQDELKSEQAQLTSLEKQAKALQDKLRKGQGVMSEEEGRKVQLQFQKAYGEYQRRAQALQQKRMQSEQEFLQQMKPRLDKVMKKLIDEEGYDLVVVKEATVFNRKELDITEQVIKRLNQQ